LTAPDFADNVEEIDIAFVLSEGSFRIGSGPMRFDLTDLRLFVHVADAASITHGAARANMALASASARIRGMEDTLGVPLLERGRRGVRLTPAGRALLHHARVILQQTERMRGELGDYAHGVKGHVRLLANTSALSELLPEMLAAFLTAYPNIDIDIEERPSFDMVEMVSQGLADAGILSDAVDMGDLEVYPFGVDQLVVIVPRGHRFARRRRIAFKEVLGETQYWVFAAFNPSFVDNSYVREVAGMARGFSDAGYSESLLRQSLVLPWPEALVLAALASWVLSRRAL